VSTDAAEEWGAKKVDVQEHEAATTSSERFSLDKDWDKLNMRPLLGKEYYRDRLTT
jgi:hypothetical protein